MCRRAPSWILTVVATTAAAAEPVPLTVGGRDWSVGMTAATAPEAPVVVCVHSPSEVRTSESALRYRELAAGLSARGVATVIYAPDGDMPIESRAMASEALAAVVGWAREQEGVDPRSIFLLGHGLDGYYVPEAAAAVSDPAGIVLLSAPSDPLAARALAPSRSQTAPVQSRPHSTRVGLWDGGAPTRHLDSDGSPVLLLRGADDGRVGADQYAALLRRLEQSSREFRAQELQGVDHELRPTGRAAEEIAPFVLDMVALWSEEVRGDRRARAVGP